MKEISGDRLSNKKDRFFYLCYNLIRGIKGYACNIRSEYWHPNKLEDGKGSPGRKYLNQFLLQELLKIIQIREVDVLDVGCGSGYVRTILTDLGYQGYYTGIDIYRHKDFDKHETYSFKSILVESKIENFKTDKKFNLILSNSTLEHIENDALAISKCNYLLKPGCSQIHIIPSFWSLFLYLWHGYRQYNPKRIKILFIHKQYKVYRLGGLFSFFLHLFFITIPVSFF